jgi:proteasome lid subunit RPN8/RPN11
MKKIPKEIITQIFSHASRENPMEACGYLAGTNDEIKKIYPMANHDQSASHFSLVPEEQFRVVKEVRSQGMEILGIYHSHPFTPARPSAEDIKLAYDPEISYLIASLMDESLNAFKIRDGLAEKENLEII